MKLPAAALVGLVLLAGCSSGASTSSQDGLATRDPSGARACADLAGAFRNKDDTTKAIQGALAAGKDAVAATTASIQAARLDLAGTPGVDAQKLHDACAAEGVSMPDVPSGS